MTIDALLDLIGEIIETDPARIDPTMDREEITGWDSLAHLRIVTAFEEAYGVRLGMEQIVEIRTVQQLSRMLEEV